jgi:hypothetical protein
VELRWFASSMMSETRSNIQGEVSFRLRDRS